MMAKRAQPFHEAVAEKLIGQLQQGCAPWQKCWQPGEPGALLPMNLISGKRYQGINALQLMSQGHGDPRWMTYKQAAAIGAQVGKGERGTPIQYWQFSQAHAKTDALGTPVRDAQGRIVTEDVPLERPRIFLAIVFNASQIDGLPPMPPHAAPDWQCLDRPEQILRASGANLCHAAQSGAFYRPATDRIYLPCKEQFPSAGHYYATALHELGHWTGHPSRLNRDLAHPFGSDGYAREELRAEITSMILGSELGIGHDPAQHAAYVASWIRLLRNDPLEIFRAAADAEKMGRFVLGLAQTQDLLQTSGQTQAPEAEQVDPSRGPVAEATLQAGATPYLGGPLAGGRPEPVVMQDTPSRNPASMAAAQEARQLEPATPGEPMRAKTFLAVPFPQHDQAKALGARWDRHHRSWYVPAHLDAAPFAKWLPAANATAADLPRPTEAVQEHTLGQVPVAERVYLAVPYAERALARAAGAAWDKGAKSWYAGPHADLQGLVRWRLNHLIQQQGPAMPPREEFAAALRAHGLLVCGEHPIMDGHKHRVAVEGGKRGARDGFYVGYLDGHPAGRIINYKTGTDETWQSKGYVLSREQATALHAQASAGRQARDAELAQLHECTSQRLCRQMTELVPLQQPTAYLTRKGIKPQRGVFTDSQGEVTYVPGMDANGKLWTMQTIGADGTKRFTKDSRKEGCFHVIGGMPALAQAPALVISEGYATASSVSQSLDFATVAAFDAGNLVHVARALQVKFPDKPVIIAGDDDRHLELTHGKNPGRTKAQEAAAATGGHLLLPIFAPGEGSYLAGLAPVTPEKYRAHGRSGLGLSKTQLAALEQMKRHTDFNDLATRSVLGKDAIDRQVRGFVDEVMRQHGAQVGQGQRHGQREDGASVQQPRQRRVAKMG
jgi:putative DNA primase/helicase